MCASSSPCVPHCHWIERTTSDPDSVADEAEQPRDTWQQLRCSATGDLSYILMWTVSPARPRDHDDCPRLLCCTASAVVGASVSYGAPTIDLLCREPFRRAFSALNFCHGTPHLSSAHAGSSLVHGMSIGVVTAVHTTPPYRRPSRSFRSRHPIPASNSRSHAPTVRPA